MTGSTLVLGGIRSGKSIFAEQIAAMAGPHVLYVATAEPSDAEMEHRIRRHRERRPEGWGLLEAPRDFAAGLQSSAGRWDAVLVNSISGWLSNLLYQKLAAGGVLSDEEPARDLAESIETEASATVAGLMAWQQQSTTPLILVSDEAGLGLVSPHPAGRFYQDLLGTTNQALAAAADRVYFIAAGLPLALKGALPPAHAPATGFGDDPDRR